MNKHKPTEVFMSARQDDGQSDHPSTALHFTPSARQMATLGSQCDCQHWLVFQHPAQWHYLWDTQV